MVSGVASGERSGRPALRRRTEHRLVAGVAGGIADRLNAPVVFVRVVVLYVASLWSPLLWAYAAAALLLPPRGRDRPGWDNLVGVGRLGLLLIAPALTLAQPLSIEELFEQSPNLWVPLVGLQLVGLAVLLSADYVRGRPRTEAEARATVLGAVPLALFVAVLAIGVFLAPDVRWDRYLPLGVVAAGAALLAGARAGRPRPYVAPALVAVALAGTLVAAGARLEGGAGDKRVAFTHVADRSLVVRRAVGDLTVDLRRVESERPVSLEASVGRGDLVVGVPNRARVTLDARVGQGAIESIPLNENPSSAHGFDQRHRHAFGARRAGPEAVRRIHVKADVGLGRIEVLRGSNFHEAGES